MRSYEMMYIIHPDQDAAGIRRVMESVQTRVESDGEVTAHDLLGKRRLAYAMKKQTQGIYCLINFNVEPSSLAALEQYLHIEHHETVLRYLVVVDEGRGIRPPAQALPEEEVPETEVEAEPEPLIVVGDDDAPLAPTAEAEAEAADAEPAAPAAEVAEEAETTEEE